MLTTKQLLQWILKAQESWETLTEEELEAFNAVEHRYNALRKTRPENALDAEVEIAYALMQHCWNDVQEYIKYL